MYSCTMKLPSFGIKRVSDCFVCAFSPILYLNMFSTFIAAIECPHYKNSKVTKPKLTITKTRVIMALFNTAFLVYNCYIRLLDLLFEYIRNETALKIGSKVMGFGQSLLTLIAQLSYMINLYKTVKYTNGLIELFYKRKNYGMDTILSGKNCERCYALSFLLCAVSLGIFMVNFLFFQLDSLWNICYAIGECLLIYMELCSGLYYIVIITSYYLLFQTIFEEIKKNMESIFESNGKISESKSKRSLFSQRLQQFQRYYLATCLNYENHAFAYATVYYSIGLYAYLIANCVFAFFCFISVLKNSGEAAITMEVTYIIRSIGLLYVVGHFYNKVENIDHLREDLLSYLFRCPLFELTTNEKIQMEALIMTLARKKTQVLVCNIFQIGYKTLGSASGFVVTYILVIVQFHTSSINY